MFGRRKKKRINNTNTNPNIFIIEEMVTDNNGIAVTPDNERTPIVKTKQSNIKKRKNPTSFVDHFSSNESIYSSTNKKKKRKKFDILDG